MGLHRQARHARSSAVAYVRQAVGSLPVVWRLPRACTKSAAIRPTPVMATSRAGMGGENGSASRW